MPAAPSATMGPLSFLAARPRLARRKNGDSAAIATSSGTGRALVLRGTLARRGRPASAAPPTSLAPQTRHCLADTALPQESLLECPKLTVEQIVGLEDQDTGNVRQGLGATARILGDRPKIIGVLTGCADGAGLDIPRIALRPTRQAMLAQPILKVQQQLLKAGPRHVGQVNLSFPQRRGGGGAFRDILPPRARGLKHLVTKSAVLPDEPIKKDDRQIEDTGRLLEREQIAKSTPLRQEGIPFLSGRTRRHGHPKTSSLAQAQSMLAL